MLSVRKAAENDIGSIMKIYEHAREFMRNTGNPTQWGTSYPSRELIESDIRAGICRVVCDENAVRGVFALLEKPDPTYFHIENGAWLNDRPYIAIHRIAGDGKAHGVFRCAADHCKALCANVRIDTHADNRIMQRRIEENGFVKCGIIHTADGSPRIAYQWTDTRITGKDALREDSKSCD